MVYCELNNKNPFLKVVPALTLAGGLYLTIESATQKQTSGNKNVEC
jgi:hypothetical protein